MNHIDNSQKIIIEDCTKATADAATIAAMHTGEARRHFAQIAIAIATDREAAVKYRTWCEIEAEVATLYAGIAHSHLYAARRLAQILETDDVDLSIKNAQKMAEQAEDNAADARRWAYTKCRKVFLSDAI